MDVTAPSMREYALTPLYALRLAGRLYRARAPVPAPYLIRFALEDGFVTTPYVIRMDADTRPLEDFDRYNRGHEGGRRRDLLGQGRRRQPQNTQAQKMQALEYRMAMLARHFRPWLTSGACTVAKTEAMRTGSSD